MGAEKLETGQVPNDHPRLLSEQEMVWLTGSNQRATQKRILDKHGIFYIVAKDGVIRTTWHHVNHPLKYISNDVEDDIDYGAANG